MIQAVGMNPIDTCHVNSALNIQWNADNLHDLYFVFDLFRDAEIFLVEGGADESRIMS